jgi:hypothetical protein
MSIEEEEGLRGLRDAESSAGGCEVPESVETSILMSEPKERPLIGELRACIGSAWEDHS